MTHHGTSFYLLAVYSDKSATGSADNVAALDAFAAVLAPIYRSALETSDSLELSDFTGQHNVALNARRQDISLIAESASKVIDLIY